MNKKRVIVDSAIVLVLVLISVFCYNMGKSYKILLENIPFAYQGERYPGIEAMYVIIDNRAKIYMLEGDRMIGVAIGKSHTLTMEFLDINDQVTETRYFDFNIKNLSYDQNQNLSLNVARAYEFGSLTE